MTKRPSAFDVQGQHWLNLRVYYEDTDFTGMIYHANYLRYFERGRSDFLRDAGVSHQDLLALDPPAAFTLTHVEVDYKRAARIDDWLAIRTRCLGVKGARMRFEQSCLRGEEIIAEGRITAIMIDMDARPIRPITSVLETLRPFVYSVEIPD